MARRDTRTLRDDAAQAAADNKPRRAVECYLALEQAEPNEPNWPKRAAEMYRRLDRPREAISAYERAVDRYVQGGFMVQAIAVCKVILQLDPASDRAKRQLASFSEQHDAGRSQAAVLSDRHHSLHALPAVEMLRAAMASPTATTPSAIPRLRPQTTPPSVVFTRPTDQLRTLEPDSQLLEAIPPEYELTLEAEGTPPADAELAEPGRLADEDRSSGSITLDRGMPLDSVDFAGIMPGAERELDHHGDSSGIIIIPLDDDALFDDSPAIEIHATTVRFGTLGDESYAAIEIEPADEPEELSIDDLEEVPLLAEPKLYSESARKALAATPLFASLSPGALESLIDHLALVDLVAGDALFREGDPGDTLYVVVEGEVAVITEGPPRIEVSRLGPGQFFGEVALVTEQPRSATIEATMVTQLLAIDREVISKLVAQHADVLPVILRFLRERLVDRLVRTHALFAPFADADRRELVSHFKFLEIEPGTTILQQGVRATGLYAMLAGKVDVIRDGARIGDLGPGELFGMTSLLTGAPCAKSVRSVPKCLALCLPASDFREIIMTHPQVLSYIGELVEERDQALPTMAAGGPRPTLV